MKYMIFIFGLTFFCCNRTSPTVKTGLEGTIMPSFNVLLMDSVRQMNTTEIFAGKPTVFFLFTPGCPYCRAMTEDIVNDMKTLNNIQFFIISSYPFEEIKEYYDHYQLKRYQNVIVGQDYSAYFQKYIRADAVPYMAIYDRERRLKEIFVGRISTELIRKSILD